MEANMLEMTNNLTQNLNQNIERENSLALTQEQNRFFDTTIRKNGKCRFRNGNKSNFS